MVSSALASTIDLLRRAFPDGIAQRDYRPLLKVLHPHVGNRNIVEVLEAVGWKGTNVLNDLYGLESDGDAAVVDTSEVTAKLEAVGFAEWLAEPG